MGKPVTDAALYGTLDPAEHPRIAASLKFIEKLTRHPGGVTPADLIPLRESGVSEHGILDAVVVCAGFNLIVRVADALAFDEPDPVQLQKGATFLLKFGYTMSSGVWLRIPRRYHGSKLEQYRAAFSDLERSVWEGPGSLPPEIRRGIGRAEGVPEPLLSFAGKVLRNALLVRESDIASLKQAGYSEDQIFEAAVSAALGAGLVRFNAGLAALF